MRKIHAIKLLVLLIVFFSIPQSLASAQIPPTQPCVYYGKVRVDGEFAEVGTLVYAKIGGEIVADSEVINQDGESWYLLEIYGDLSLNNALIEFFVGYAKADQTGIWQSGITTPLDLTAPGTFYSFLPVVFR